MEKIFYASPEALPGGDGSSDNPFSTLTEARDAIRKMRKDGTVSAADSVTVNLRAGVYYQERSFELDASDAGSEGAPVTYKSCKGEKAIITGAKDLDSSRFYKPDAEILSTIEKKYPEAAKKIVAYDLGKEGINCEGDIQIYWNGKRGMLARYPNKDFSFMSGVRQLSFDGDRTWRYTFEDKDKIVQTWRGLDGVEIIGNFFFDWAGTEGTIFENNASDNTVSIECNGEARDNGRYFFRNVFDEIDIPGEYYIDKKNKILYFYPEGDILETDIKVTQCAEYVILARTDYVTFEDVMIEGGQKHLVRFDGTGLTLRGCTLCRSFRSGVRVDGYRTLISRCEFYTIGADAIDMGGGDPIKLTPADSEISDCIFHEFGELMRVYFGAVFLRGRGIRCYHNEMYNTPHLAISISGSELDIQYNYIHDVCYEANDAGAVYLGGWAPNDVIFDHNIIKDIINKYGDGFPNGYYNDDGGAGKTIRSNIFINIGGNAFAMGGGRDNIILDNIMINTRLSYDERLYYDQWEMHNAIYPTAGLWNNLLKDPGYGTKQWAIRYPRTMLIKATNVRDYNSRFVPYAFGHTTVRNNVTWHPKKMRMDIQPDTMRLSNFRDNIDYDSLEDIGFVDFENGDYRLKPESRVLHDLPGFAACDFTLAGVR